MIRISNLPHEDDIPPRPSPLSTPSSFHDEPLMTIPQAATFIGRLTGKKPNVSTIWRWCLKGVRGVILESIRVGGQRFISQAALARFIEQSTARGSNDPRPPSSPSAEVPSSSQRSDRRREEIEAAAAGLTS